jgi:hypothetical protein
MKMTNLNLQNGIISLLLAALSGVGFIFFFVPIRNVSILSIIIIIAVLAVIFTIGLNKRLFEPYLKFSGIGKGLSYLFILFFTFCLLISLKGPQSFLQDNHILVRMYVYISTYFILLFFVLFAIRIMYRLNGSESSTEIHKIKIILYALPSIAVFSLYLLGFFPGIMTMDSFVQWEQMHSNQYNDWHPVVHTWFLKLITQVWDYPAAVAIVQILFMSIVFGYGMYTFEKHGAPKWILYAVTAVFALMPLNGIYSVTLWKDVLYSTFLMLFTILLFNIVKTDGKWLRNPGSLLLFFLASIGFSFFRHNGFAVFVVTMAIFFIIYRLKLTRMYAVALVIVVLHFVITGPVFKYFHVKPSDPNEAYSVPIQQIGRVIAYGGNITKKQLDFYDKVLPIEEWRTKYTPDFADPIKGNPKYNREFLYAHKDEFFKHWLELCKQNPKMVAMAYADLSALVWEIHPTNGYSLIYASEPPGETVLKEHNIKVVYGNQHVKSMLQSVLAKIGDSYLRILYRPATYLFMILLFTFIIIIKRNWKLSLIALPVLLNTGTIAAALPAQDVRYLYANFLIVLIMFLAAIKPTMKKRV